MASKKTSSRGTSRTSGKKAAKASSKKSAKKPSKKTAGKRGKKGGGRGKLAPRREKRGLEGDALLLDLDSPDLAPLVEAVRDAGGTPLGAYREPFAGHPLLLAALPLQAVAPTPFQRDLSPTHTKRLAARIEDSGAFLDPLIVVRGLDGRLWTPNGRHRLAAAKTLGLRQVTALVSPDEDLAFKILALNTEKAHNLRDRSLEVIRMARSLAERSPRRKESDFAAEFEAPEYLTLGIIYEEEGRFGGGAYGPVLRKVDRFRDRAIATSLRDREGQAARLREIDAEVKRVVEGLKERGFRSPYLRSYVVARINPVRFHRRKKGETEPPMTLSAALTRMAGAVREFDPESVKPGDLALVAALSSDAEGEG